MNKVKKTKKEQEQTINQKEKVLGAKSDDSFVKRGLILILFVFIGICAYSYEQYKEGSKEKGLESEMIKAMEKAAKSDSFERKVFDLKDEVVVRDLKSNNSEDQIAEAKDTEVANLSDVKKNENLAENITANADFKNLEQKISNLEQKLSGLEQNLAISHEIIRRNEILLAYDEFKKKLYLGTDYNLELRKLQVVSSGNKFLEKKVLRLKLLAKDFKNDKWFANEFNNLVPDLLARQKHDPNQGFFEKLRYNVDKIFIVKRTDNKGQFGQYKIDGFIDGARVLLGKKEYTNLLNAVSKLELKYQNILRNFIQRLENRVEFMAIDRDIILIIKNNYPNTSSL